MHCCVSIREKLRYINTDEVVEMCLYIDSETILANLLVNKRENERVFIFDIKQYCSRLHKLLDEQSYSPYRYFDISDESLSRAVYVHSEVFVSLGDSFFRQAEIHIEQYNMSYETKIHDVLVSAGKDVS